MLEIYYKYIRNVKVKLSPTYLILTLMTFSPIIVNFLLFSSRSLFKIKKLIKYLPKPCLFIIWFNIVFFNILGINIKSVSYN